MKSNTLRTLGASNHADHEREANDFYSTDPNAVRMLLELETFSQYIREPACGEGHLSKEMERLGKDVYSTDLIDRGYGDGVLNFLECNEANIKDIITNPPYTFAEDFIRQSMRISRSGVKIAMFLKIQFLEGKKRKLLFKEFPPKVIYVSSSRIQCAINGLPQKNSSAVCYARYVREKGYDGDTLIKWFN